VAKPTKHGDKWRIRWVDECGKRQSVFDDYRRAQTELSRHQVEEVPARGPKRASAGEDVRGHLRLLGSRSAPRESERKPQRKRRRPAGQRRRTLRRGRRHECERVAGLLKGGSVGDAADYLKQDPALAGFLDRATGGGAYQMVISEHIDKSVK
jgi:hypothetical protein